MSSNITKKSLTIPFIPQLDEMGMEEASSFLEREEFLRAWEKQHN